MNLLLLFKQDFTAPNRVRLTEHRLKHLLLIKKLNRGDALDVGLVNDKMGEGRVLTIDKYHEYNQREHNLYV